MSTSDSPTPGTTPPLPAAGVICNPLDLSYRYQDVRFTGVVAGRTLGEPRRSVHREAADPSIVRFKDRYFLFASMSAGFWHSTDLVDWVFASTTELPAFDYAPDVREIDGALYVCASRKTDSPFFRSADPLGDGFERVAPGSFPFWDPHLFQDDDGAAYLYWGCDAATPIQGVPIDLTTMTPTAEPRALIASDRFARGWEAMGEDHRRAEPRTEREKLVAQFVSADPFIEGAWMNQIGDTYYLQYAAPGTELNTYADGYYTGTAPLGPFEYSPHSPFSSKPGGFITGAGHGSTFVDVYGNWWHAATMRISINDVFERRIGLFPAGIDADGVMFCNQNFGDYPILIPGALADPWSPPPWMLLSRGARVSASSSAKGHPADLAVDEDIRTWWVAGAARPGEHLTVDVGRIMSVAAVQVNLADHDLAARAVPAEGGADFGHSCRAMYLDAQSTPMVVESSIDGVRWDLVGVVEGDRPHALLVLEAPRSARFVRVTAGAMPFDAPFAMSGLRVFGHADGDAPRAPRATAERVGPLRAMIRWEAVDGARGYNVRYGIHPEKLYHSWLVHDSTELDLRALNAGVPYWVAVDAFNESGVTAGTVVGIG